MTHYEQEIVALHQFFEDWFNAKLPNSEATFARFADAMAPDFHIVSPSGALAPREAIVGSLRNAYGAQKGLRIWIENVTVGHIHGDIAIVMYEEWQQKGDDPPLGRLSTVVFAADTAGPNGVIWLHVHETWLPSISR